jgi:Domain of unknown function (DUF5658)
MPPSAWRLLMLPLILLAFLLVGTPDFPAFARAVQKAFDSAIATPQPHSRGSRLPAKAQDETRGGRLQPAQNRGILVPLYVSFATLQALDAHSTLRALNAGATEANPIVAGVAGTPAALVAMKAGVAASTIYLVEKVRVKSRRAAIVLMAALNSAYAAIVAHNYRGGPH